MSLDKTIHKTRRECDLEGDVFLDENSDVSSIVGSESKEIIFSDDDLSLVEPTDLKSQDTTLVKEGENEHISNLDKELVDNEHGSVEKVPNLLINKKKNQDPTVVPRSPQYFCHDNRESGLSDVDESKDIQSSRVWQKPGKGTNKLWNSDKKEEGDGKWVHDKFYSLFEVTKQPTIGVVRNSKYKNINKKRVGYNNKNADLPVEMVWKKRTTATTQAENSNVS